MNLDIFRTDVKKSILSKYIKNTKNIEIIEKNLYKISEEDINVYRKNLYELINLLNSESKIDVKQILQIVKENNIGWYSKSFDDIRNNIDERDNFLIKPFELVEGVLECKKCGSKKTYSYTKQMRGGDEATTVFAVCGNCRSTWIAN
jgi:DNA-directed RNA polymerase subunit M/transcription elongation factor TFIIS